MNLRIKAIMNNLILMSIKTKYANNIFNGSKKYEYRKSSIKEYNLNKKIIIYSSEQAKAILGYIIIDKILEGSLDFIIKETNPKESNINDYFKNAKKCYAMHIKEYHRFKSPITLNEIRKIDNNIVIPQYYRYIREEEPLYKLINERLDI